METLVILLIAASLAAAVVWWASTPRAPRAPRPRARRVSFSETFQTTAPEPTAPPEIVDDGFVLATAPAVPDDRPSRALAVLRIMLTIAFVAVIAVGTVAVFWLLVKLRLDQYFR